MRPMVVNDVRNVRNVDREVFSMPWPGFIFAHEIDHNKLAFMGLIEGQRAELDKSKLAPLSWLQKINYLERPLVAYGGVWLDGGEGHISTLATVPQFQRQGFGELMLLGLLWRAVVAKMERATLEVRQSNVGAQSLYRKYGFEVVETQYAYYRDNDEDAYIMKVRKLDADYQAFLRERWAVMYTKFDFADRYSGYSK